MPKALVIVESPTKAKTLRKYLGTDYIVESSVGHIRDLPANAAEVPAKYKGEKWSRLGVNVEDNFDPLYIVRPEKKKKIAELKAHLKEVDKLLLATDEDREGEAIAWHLLDVLQPKVPVERMVFHEITKTAILAALADTRQVDMAMVEAQESRRIIDRLYGYEISPTLWRKIGPKLSAGRVQSVAISMLVDRERARMRFKDAEYWDLSAHFLTDPNSEAKGRGFDARLMSVDGKRVASGKDFDPDTGELKPGAKVSLLDAKAADELRASLASGAFTIASAEEKPFKKSPSPPFTTSTLQQEGNRKLRFDAKRIMRAAQRLYENGHITYMRTDSVALSDTAIEMARTAIGKEYGKEYLPEEPRRYKGKSKNAQEAHEAIRTAGEEVVPVATIRASLGEDEAKIYDLIRSRTLASQMKDAHGRRMVLRVEAPGGPREVVFQASGSVIDFPGFLRAYVESSDAAGSGSDDKDVLLPPVNKGDSVTSDQLTAEEHRTTPPARLTEASLVKALEESGIGRPSTYASIIDTIQTRAYSFKKGSALVPTFTAFAVVYLMETYFTKLVDPAFTAQMEERLDLIAAGEGKSKAYLRDFYHGDGVVPEGPDDVPTGLKPLVDHTIETIDPRRVCTIPIGEDDQGRAIIVRVGRYGPFVQREETTAPLPDPCCPDEVTVLFASELLAAKERSEKPIGTHPDTEEPVFVKTGRYGPYVQLGEATDDHKPKMASLLKDMRPDELDFDTALQLLALPRLL
ncbi:MAG: DNA topoisomerase-1, partial [Planctomycetota bacterium]